MGWPDAAQAQAGTLPQPVDPDPYHPDRLLGEEILDLVVLEAVKRLRHPDPPEERVQTL